MTLPTGTERGKKLRLDQKSFGTNCKSIAVAVFCFVSTSSTCSVPPPLARSKAVNVTVGYNKERAEPEYGVMVLIYSSRDISGIKMVFGIY